MKSCALTPRLPCFEEEEEEEEEEEKKKKKASSILHEAKVAYYAFDAAILFASSIGRAVAKAT